jgi:hypothetical protein
MPGTVKLPINRCGHCRRRLFDGWLVGVVKCPHCNGFTKFFDKAPEHAYNAAKTETGVEANEARTGGAVSSARASFF